MFRKIIAAATTLFVAGALSLAAVAGPAFADGSDPAPTPTDTSSPAPSDAPGVDAPPTPTASPAPAGSPDPAPSASDPSTPAAPTDSGTPAPSAVAPQVQSLSRSQPSGPTLVTLTAPGANAATCTADGRLVLPSNPLIVWSGARNGAGPGTYTVTASVKDPSRYTLGSQQTTWTVVVPVIGRTADGGSLDCGGTRCLPSSAVSYTYDRYTNSGVITVQNTKPRQYIDTLCDPFSVIAVSWAYETTGTWPQTLVGYTTANDGHLISTVGTYAYGNPVTCGQGDVYAAYGTVPTPPAQLNGQGDPYHELFLSQMGFVNPGPDDTWTATDPSCHVTEPVAPTVGAKASCGVEGKILWTDDAEKVTYALTRGNGVSGINEVTATAHGNWIFPDNTTTHVFTVDLGTPADCTTTVIVADPTATSATCQDGEAQNGTITVGLEKGVDYEITGPHGAFTPTQRTTSVPAGVYTVTATPADDSYVLDFSEQSTWPFTITVGAADCGGDIPTLADFSVDWTSTNATCSTGSGTVTVGPADFAGYVNFFLDGKPVTPGQPVAARIGDHVVSATPVDPSDTVDDSPQTATVKGSSTICPTELKTLALTGTGNPTPWIFGGIALLQLGLALVAVGWVRKRLERRSA